MNIPNSLSVFRLALVPVFVYTFFFVDNGTAIYTFSAAILLISGFSDFLDGYIARKYNMITYLGKILDPLADKLTQATVCVALALRDSTFWILAIAFLVKETLFMLASLVVVKSKLKIQGSKWFGKLATAIFYLAIFLIVLLPDLIPVLVNILITAVLISLFFAFLMYIGVFVGIMREKEKK